MTINADSSTIELHLARICTVQVCGELCLPAEALEMLMQIEIKMDGTVLHLAGACPPPALCWQSAHDCATKEISKLIHLNTWPRKIGDCFSAGSVGWSSWLQDQTRMSTPVPAPGLGETVPWDVAVTAERKKLIMSSKYMRQFPSLYYTDRSHKSNSVN